MSQLTFTFYDRGGKQERIVTINPETCNGVIEMYDVAYYQWTEEPKGVIKAVDPDGGPCFYLGFRIGDYEIKKITHIQSQPNEKSKDLPEWEVEETVSVFIEVQKVV
jgi:hypothetical protein